MPGLRTTRAEVAGAARTRTCALAIGLTAGLVVLAGCSDGDTGTSPEPPARPVVKTVSPESAAAWQFEEGEKVTRRTTTFRVEVVGTMCDGGQKREALPPQVIETEAEVIVTFEVADPPQSGVNLCNGGPPAHSYVRLSEPLGDRALLDGICSPGNKKSDTSYCDPTGFRWSAERGMDDRWY